MASQRRRSDDEARIRLLQSCSRPGFAETGIYRKPVGSGKHAEGLSIRFAEEARRQWGNIETRTQVILDDTEKRILRVSATDLETNVTESVDVIIEKTVERRQLKDGQSPIRQRINSYGDLVYLVPAD